MMKLSEAIRLGAMLQKQCFSGYYGRGTSCAMGAALEAVGKRSSIDDHNSEKAYALWPWLRFYEHRRQICPLGCDLVCTYTGLHLIAHLNDTHRWTGERIADWVATVEPKEEAQAAPEPVCCSTSAE